MLHYFTKRLFLFVPTLLVISIVLFFISSIPQGNANSTKSEYLAANTSFTNITEEWSALTQQQKEAGLHLPLFYFSIFRKSSTDTLQRIVDERIRENLKELAYQYDSWELTNTYFYAFKKILYENKVSLAEQQELVKLVRTPGQSLDAIVLLKNPNYTSLVEAAKALKNNPSSSNNYLPSIKWHGKANQYHRWIVTTLSGKLANSLQYGRSSKAKFTKAIYWTLILGSMALIFSLLIGVGTGIYAALHQGKTIDKFLSLFFYGLYSIPNFFLATLLVILFASNSFVDLLPSYGIGNLSGNEGWWEQLSVRTSHLILPVICLTYNSIAFIFRQVRNSIIKEFEKEYVKTAKAKGLDQSTILWKQVAKNASFPLITLLTNIIPSILSGSFIIEYIFSIPGMGKLTIEAFLSRDYPFLFSILMLSAVISMIGVFVADLLYFLNDPRVSYTKQMEA